MIKTTVKIADVRYVRGACQRRHPRRLPGKERLLFGPLKRYSRMKGGFS